MLPTPYIQFLSHDVNLDRGGLIEEGDLYLKNIPAKKYSEEQLVTTTDDPNIEKYWVVHGPALTPKAYTTSKIDRKNAILFDVVLSRYKSLNEDYLNTVLGLNE